MSVDLNGFDLLADVSVAFAVALASSRQSRDGAPTVLAHHTGAADSICTRRSVLSKNLIEEREVGDVLRSPRGELAGSQRILAQDADIMSTEPSGESAAPSLPKGDPRDARHDVDSKRLHA